MAQLRNQGAVRRAGEIRDQTVTLRRSMRHDEPMQVVTRNALKAIDQVQQRAQEIVDEEEADASLSSRSDLELRCFAANGESGAVSELTRRTAVPVGA